ncbi:hypothetical protein F0562_031753 [Nyssa sinensis]|uniref:Putative zinc-finger domain-containing protein n=1 Tax=Nyssa sinensis TaxID=561372 RepID=A0A5J5AWP5_9ASTE|nr:hypothetical protein F0562_031753 [Nyssa sinensis]
MEESDELRAKAITSTGLTANPNPEVNSSKSREEGELSSSDDDELPAGSVARITSTTAAGKEPVPVDPVNKNTQGVKAGKSISTNNSASFVDVPSRTSTQPNYHKSFEKNRVPFVISFSDDDSGSDSEECTQEKTLETKCNSLGVDANRRPPASSLAKSQILQRTTRNETKVMPKRVSLSRTFVSSTAKINGGISKNGGPSFVGPRSRVRNFNTLKQKLSGLERKGNQNVHLNSRKLQDLRQQIALWENKLKLKPAQQNKETISGSCRDYNISNLKNDADGKCGSAEFVQFEPKEPDKKRLKVSGTHSSQLSDDLQETLAAQSMLASEKSVLEKRVHKSIDDRSCRDKEVPLGITHTSVAQWPKQDDNRGPASSGDLPNGVKYGSNVITNRSESDRNNKMSDSFILLGHTAQVANLTPKIFPEKSNMEKLKRPNELNCHHTPRSIPKKATCGHNITRSSEFHEIRSGDKVLKPTLDDTHQACSLYLPNGNRETSDASLNNASLWNCLCKANTSKDSNMDIQSLLDVEELQDKELEEAQEHRRKCEVEERNALKAYRKVQRALMEANARCSYLYRKRELYSAQFQSLLMEDSSLLWSSRLHNHIGAEMNSLNNMSEGNVHLIPTSSHQKQAEFGVCNQQGYGSNIQSAIGTLRNGSDRHVNGQNLASDPCSEPDASTSEPHKDNCVTDGLCSPSNDLNMSEDEDEETFPIDRNSVQSSLDYLRKDKNYEERGKDINESARNFSFDNSQDSLLLEASLRSQLFARLGMKTLSKEGPSHSMEATVERGSENDDDGEKIEVSMGNIPFSEAEKDQCSDLRGVDREEGGIHELPVQISNHCHVEKSSSNHASLSTADPLDGCHSTEDHQSTRAVAFSCPILRSVLGHVKDIESINMVGLQARNQQIQSYDIYNEKGNGGGSDEILPSILNSNSMEEIIKDKCVREDGFYSCNLAVDPFWPLCMYELRGKCNNDECSWQHLRDYSGGNMNHHISDTSDCCVGLSSNGGNYSATNISKCLNRPVLAPPTYLVCLDILKADLHSYESVLARSIGECWQKCFSASLVLSSFLPTDLSSDEPFLHATDTRIEVRGSWNRKSSYFHSRNGTMSQLDHHMVDNDQLVEMALLNLNHEANKQRGRLEALKVLARALEADPTSVVLWIVYLHIYYCNEKSIGKDDMFYCAVEHNEGSYELWLIYINSRVQLEDRLIAYDTALSALCRHASSSDRDPAHASACILDLFLQMMNCLCISGNVGKAIEKTYGLFPTTKNSDKTCPLLLSDILAFLTISDKCIFWVCCVYLIVYGKLPDIVVQQFECVKEVSAIEWPSTHSTVDEKQQAVTLMELAVDYLALHIDSESLESETTLKAAHLFAVNHIRCIAVLEGFECSRNLLDKYTRLYPSCLELVFMSARAQVHVFGDLSFVGFEKALSSWPEEVPGVQCIWNQYAECAFQNGKFEFVEELMDRWFHSLWNVQSQNGFSDTMDRENSLGSLESASASDPDAWMANFSQIDVLFGLLNLSLFKLLKNDHIEGRLAIDRALKVAAAEYYKHCVREHATFLLADGSQCKEDAPVSGILKILHGYLVDMRAHPASEPLSRMFIQSIKKPRVRQLVSNMWSPVSSDFSLVNLVLEGWHGPSLLPQRFTNIKDLVDLIEAIMEILPSNYQLAISVCKLLSGIPKSASVSFWASSLLVNALFQAVPVAPEYVWVEAAGILLNLTDIQSISESFHKRALSVYPFSIKLWESYLNLSRTTGNTSTVTEAARAKGIKLD